MTVKENIMNMFTMDWSRASSVFILLLASVIYSSPSHAQIICSTKANNCAPSGGDESGSDWQHKGGTVYDQPTPSIIIPTSTFTGATPGKAAVSGGAASYQVPINIVPGRAGMQPSVALNYSGRAGNGLAGVGWNISTGAALTRCPATTAQDGYVGSVSFTTNDKLCLNGQRLINISGSYGQTNTRYKLEIDNFTIVTQKAGSLASSSAYFEVVYPNGRKEYFGSEVDSRITPSGITNSLTWLLDKTQDVSGKNHMSYRYIDFGHGEKLLKSINYTGNGVNNGHREVRFLHEPRAKFSTQYQWGGKTRSTQRLASIETYYGKSKVRAYNLTYTISDATGRSILESVQECGYQYGILCKDKTTFNWSQQETNWVLEPLVYDDGNTAQYITDPSFELDKVIPRGDVNGDGVRDWKAVFVNAEGQKTETNYVELNNCQRNYSARSLQCISADFNSDGLTDDWDVTSGKMRLRITQRHSNATVINTNVSLTSKVIAERNNYIKQAADYNGDGWVDLMVYEYNNSHPRIRYYEHSGNVNSPYSSGTIIYNYNTLLVENVRFAVSSIDFHGDLDGNGLPDMVISDTYHNLMRASLPQPHPTSLILTSATLSGTSFQTKNLDLAKKIEFSDDDYSFFGMFVDVNGDGLADIIGWLDGSSSKYLQVKFNQGAGLFSSIEHFNVLIPSVYTISGYFPADNSYFGIHSPTYLNAFKVMDINGDGKPELLMPGNRIVTGCSKHNLSIPLCGSDLYKA
jgi:hypothetical protein